MNKLFSKQFDTPVGRMIAMATARGLCALEYQTEVRMNLWDQRRKHWLPDFVDTSGSNEHIETAEAWLAAYFHAQWKNLPDISLDKLGSQFELQVWEAILHIPKGKTKTYSDIAKSLSNPNGARAVGNAARRNPIIIIVPCHRIVGAKTNLIGYAGGLAAKEFLLCHEGATRYQRPIEVSCVRSVES